ncbi:FAD/NAD(P)-binding domain-containing protein [Coprinopsis marcescibilis]|uniref:FAD/NAD(P)-binding domain-containing protein n=1 Tax=Coprinopsis marcescibilis TaxID=230819 RepID=A0A5C3KM98_COPMA|nr:FAD/NAD(P)-binding domain-containing protein [Coprinopsis marcescibilis]
MSKQLQNIVVLGGGAAGAGTALAIVNSSNFNPSTHRLILVTPRSFFVLLPAVIRASVTSEGDLEKRILMPYGDFLKGKGEVKVGKAVSFTSAEAGGEVTLESGEKLEYSVLVLALGSIWQGGALNIPDDETEAVESLKTWRANFQKATDIVLVGGGSVGIEYAGEILDFFPNKRVTLVHNQDNLLNNTYPERFRQAALARVRKTGTEVILGDRLEELEPSSVGTVRTKKGRTIHADLVIPTWGARPNTELVRKSLGSEALSLTGHVKVLPTLQLASHPRIFAVGDIIDWEEQKQAAKTSAHAGVAAPNVLAVATGASLTKEYKGSMEGISITIGRSAGVSYVGILWGIILGDWFTSFIKGKGLLIDMTRSHLGLPPPAL